MTFKVGDKVRYIGNRDIDSFFRRAHNVSDMYELIRENNNYTFKIREIHQSLPLIYDGRWWWEIDDFWHTYKLRGGELCQ